MPHFSLQLIIWAQLIGRTRIEKWTGEYANQSVSFVSYDSSDMVNKLSNGCVAIIHGTSSNVSSGGTHYMAILDISEDKSKVYVSFTFAKYTFDVNDFKLDVV